MANRFCKNLTTSRRGFHQPQFPLGGRQPWRWIPHRNQQSDIPLLNPFGKPTDLHNPAPQCTRTVRMARKDPSKGLIVFRTFKENCDMKTLGRVVLSCDVYIWNYYLFLSNLSVIGNLLLGCSFKVNAVCEASIRVSSVKYWVIYWR